MDDYMAKSILITQRAVSDGSAVSLSPVPQALSALNKPWTEPSLTETPLQKDITEGPVNVTTLCFRNTSCASVEASSEMLWIE